MAGQKLQIDAEQAQPHPVAAANIGEYILIALKYLSVFASVLGGLATGNLDQTIKGIRVGNGTYDVEIIAKKRQ